MRLRPYLLCLALGSLSTLACSSEPTATTAVVRPQLVAVDPADFLGTIGCAPAPESAGGSGGAVNLPCQPDKDPDPKVARSYVATLFDVTPEADGGVPNPGTPLASSPPTTCLKPVTFSFVVTGHRYLAEVDAYHERPECLTPISAGSRLLSDPQGARVVPRWVATCGGYPPSPLDAGTESGGAPGTSDAGTSDAGTGQGGRPPGVVSYAALTQTPHACDQGLHDPP